MPEPIDAWWARRQFTHGVATPYPLGRYREEWAAWPVLIRQYHPELNGGIALTQIPPAAEVWLCWQCEAGHLFVATPTEQRSRPGGGRRRRSAWCPECAGGAIARPAPVELAARPRPERRATRRRSLCASTPDVPPGTAFRSGCAPRPASAAEADLRAGLAARLAVDLTPNAVRLRQPFFDHVEAWPDLVLDELRVAVEYDTPGRHGLEHVGRREESDRRKDRLLRHVGWEVVRIRTGRLPALGPHDLLVAGPSRRLAEQLIERLRVVRGDLLVDAYLV